MTDWAISASLVKKAGDNENFAADRTTYSRIVAVPILSTPQSRFIKRSFCHISLFASRVA
jgi:hypothetical protein